jgi:hypothetical protein
MTLDGHLGDLAASLSPGARRRRREAGEAELANVRQVARQRLALLRGLPEPGGGKRGLFATAPRSSAAGSLAAATIMVLPGPRSSIGARTVTGRRRIASPARAPRDLRDTQPESVRRRLARDASWVLLLAGVLTVAFGVPPYRPPAGPSATGAVEAALGGPAAGPAGISVGAVTSPPDGRSPDSAPWSLLPTLPANAPAVGTVAVYTGGTQARGTQARGTHVRGGGVTPMPSDTPTRTPLATP